MKPVIAFACMVGLCILFCGCPYLSDVPIDKPLERINPAWLGTWEEQKDHDMYEITKQDGFTYHIEVRHHSTMGGKPTLDKHRAYTSVVNGTTFINQWDDTLPSPATKYALVKIEMDGNDRIDLSPVTENIRETFSSCDALKQFIAANMVNSYFFDRPVRLVRVNKQ